MFVLRHYVTDNRRVSTLCLPHISLISPDFCSPKTARSNTGMSTFEVDLLLAKCRNGFADFKLLPRATPLMVGCDSSLGDAMLGFLFSCNPRACGLNVTKHVFQRFHWCFFYTLGIGDMIVMWPSGFFVDISPLPWHRHL